MSCHQTTPSLIARACACLPLLLGIACAAPIEEEDADASDSAVLGAPEKPKSTSPCEKQGVFVDGGGKGLPLGGSHNGNACLNAGKSTEITFTSKATAPYDANLTVGFLKEGLKDPKGVADTTKLELIEDDNQGLDVQAPSSKEIDEAFTFSIVIRHAEMAKKPARFRLKLPAGVEAKSAWIEATPMGGKDVMCSPRGGDEPVCYTGKCRQTVDDDGVPAPEKTCF
jgi:hypothetical protein